MVVSENLYSQTAMLLSDMEQGDFEKLVHEPWMRINKLSVFKISLLHWQLEGTNKPNYILYVLGASYFVHFTFYSITEGYPSSGTT